MRRNRLAICARAAMAAGLVLTLLSMIWSCLSHRPLFADAAGWYINVLCLGKTWIGGPLLRFADRLLQLPSLGALLAARGVCPSCDVTGLFVYLQHFCYVFHPLMSLAVCWWLLRRRNRTELFVFPAVSLATATQCSIAFVAGIAPLTLSVFWPVFLLALLRDPRSIRENAALAAATLVLALTYEMALLFFLLLAAQEIFLAYRSKEKKRSSHVAMGAFFALGIVFFAFRISGPLADDAGTGGQRFWDSFSGQLRADGPYYYFSTVALFCVLSLSLVFSFAAKAVSLISGAYAALALGGMAYAVHRTIEAMSGARLPLVSAPDSFQSRVLSVPLAFVVASACFFCAHFLSRRLIEPKVRHACLLFAGLALIVGASLDGLITLQWSKGLANLQTLLNEKPGCTVVKERDYDARFYRFGFADYSFSQISILLQKSRKIRSIAIPESFQRRIPGEDLCETVRRGFLPQRSSEPAPLASFHYFNFSELTP